MENTQTFQQLLPHPVHSNTIYRVIIVSVFIVFILIGLYLGFSNGPQPAKNAVMSKNSALPTGTVAQEASMKVVSSKTQYKVGESVPIQIIMDSAGSDINGMDLLLKYNSADMTINQIQATIPGIQLFQFKKPTYYSLTAAKLLAVQEPLILSSSSAIMATITFKTPGKKTVSILNSVGKEQTKLVDTHTNIIIPTLTSLQLEIL